jgi:hypothetical protein
MQKPFANSVSQALLYRFTELGYSFLTSPDDMSYITLGTGYVMLPNTIQAHYEFLRSNHDNTGLDKVLHFYCFSLLESEGISPETRRVFLQHEFDSLFDLILFCLEVENEA